MRHTVTQPTDENGSTTFITKTPLWSGDDGHNTAVVETRQPKAEQLARKCPLA